MLLRFVVKIGLQSIFLFFLASALGFPLQAQDTSNKKTKSKASPWSVNCSNTGKGLICQLSQRIVLKKTKQLLIAVTVKKSDKGKTMLIQLPHGLYLPAGIKLQVDENKQTSHPIQTCDQTGCYAGLPLGEQTVKSLKSGQTFKVVFQNLSKKNVTVPLPLNGFEAAYKKL